MDIADIMIKEKFNYNISGIPLIIYIAKFSFGFLVERTMAVQENSHTATNKGLFNIL